MIQTDQQLAELLPTLAAVDRVAVDTEADSLHCYFEKLCLIQISVPRHDYLVDPLADLDLKPLAAALARKEIVLQGADFDLRLLRRSLDFVATRIFDTVIAARLLGIRSFSLAALVEKFFGVTLAKGSQKANWARRPLPQHMAEYAMNDTRYRWRKSSKRDFASADGWSGSASPASARWNKRQCNARATTKKRGEFPGLANWEDAPPRFCASCGDGATRKPRLRTARLFMFCRIMNCCARRSSSLQGSNPITVTFRHVGVRAFAKRPNAG